MKKLKEHPNNFNKKKQLNIGITIFIFALLIIATSILFWVFWDNIIYFISKSGALLLLIAGIVIMTVVPAIIVSKIKTHDEDEY